MRYTLRDDDTGLYHWTYLRGMFFFSGVSKSRYAAIKALLSARQEASEAMHVYRKWMDSIKEVV